MPSASLSSRRNSRRHGLQLSWPSANDARRNMVATLRTSHRDPVACNSDSHFVHTSYTDLERHYDLPAAERPNLNSPLQWNPLLLENGHADLFEYFQHTASQSLAIFPHEPKDLGNALIQMTLSSHTKSATAALLSLLAFASIHRHNVHSQAVELKLSALKAMTAITGSHVGTEEAIHHVIAGMLLLSFEIHQTSCTSGHWECYLDGVKTMITMSGLAETAHVDTNVAMLLAWVRYHDVLRRFTLAHWTERTKLDTEAMCAVVDMRDTQCELSPTRSHVSLAASPGVGIVELLSDVCDALPALPAIMAAAESVDEYRSFLKILDWKIRNVYLTAPVDESVNTSSTMEVYKLAVAIYLDRATESMLNQAIRTQTQIDMAFSLLAQMESCPQQFPVFVLGCEARTDDQRATVLDLISRTENKPSSRSFGYVKAIIHAIWAQNDLANGDIKKNVKYRDKIGRAFGLCRNLPVLV